jgi:hypothetical protein
VDRDGEAVIRHFIEAIDEWSLPLKGATLLDLYDILGYKIAGNGARINKLSEETFKFGTNYDPEDEFYADWQEITDEEIAEVEDTSEPSASGAAESPEVREGVLREEV